MSNSSLATERYPAYSGNYTPGRRKPITAITIHHMAGVLSAKQCGGIFQRPGRKASSNYGIGVNGEIAVYVDEKDTSWCNSNWDSNCRSITIETSNNQIGGDWTVSDASLNSLIRLVADIAKRNNLGRLVKGQNLTWHRMFANTTCPGPYLLSKIDYIIEEANKINFPPEPPKPEPSTGLKVGDKVIIRNTGNGSSYGDANIAYGLGWSREILQIYEGRPYPYRVGNSTGTTGFYQEHALEKE